MMEPMTEAEFVQWLSDAARTSPVAHAFWELLRSEHVTPAEAAMLMARHLLEQNAALTKAAEKLIQFQPPIVVHR